MLLDQPLDLVHDDRVAGLARVVMTHWVRELDDQGRDFTREALIQSGNHDRRVISPSDAFLLALLRQRTTTSASYGMYTFGT